MTRVAVIGAGSMGRNHLRVLRDLPQAELVAVSDSDPAAAAAAGRLHGIAHYDDHRQLLQQERPEAVTVAVPTRLHRQVGLDVLGAGCHALVEKPLAATVEEARELVEAAAAAGLVLMAGHVERYNPAVIELKRRLQAGELGRIFQVNARRQGPFPERVRDVGVVLDLATHDVDIMRYLCEREVVRVYAEISREVHGSNEDLACALLRLEGGVVGVLEVSWLTPAKIREVTVTGEKGMFRAEYLTQDLYFWENAHPQGQWEHLQILRGVSEGAMTRFAIPKQEPLRLELGAFLEAAPGRPAEVVSGADGLQAICLAQALLESGREGRAVELRP